MSIDIERLVGGLTPANPADPRTFPAIWNDTADDIEQLDGDVTTLTGRVDNLDTDDVAEATNLYYTDARVQDVIAASTTDDLDEGSTNLYYTDARAEAAADGRIAAATTDDLSEGSTNLYYTDARVEAVIAGSTTDDLDEGATNLYYTDARAEAAAPVQTVNTQTGDVVLAAGDVGAYPDTNPDAYVDAAGAAAAAPVQSVNTQTGTVSLGAGDVGALPDDADLGDLNDVDTSGAAAGDVLAYDGSEWVPDGTAVRSDDVSSIETISQTDYDLLSPPDPNTMYIVI